MSSEHQGKAEGPGAGGSIGDYVAIKIQELYRESKIDAREALLKIDNREEAAQAPFQFDPAAGLLHRRDCKAIPDSARSALYGVWRVSAVEAKFACPRCRPAGAAERPEPERKAAGPESAQAGASAQADPRKDSKPPQGDVADLLYGVLSIVNQFGSVLRERGREFRRGGEGGRIKTELEGLYAKLGEREKGLVLMTMLSLDQMTRKIRDLEQDLNGAGKPANKTANGHDNGHPAADGKGESA
jgi:hypothetical protein